jgi:hypothetical protein
LNATAAANNNITATTINNQIFYNANAAAGGHTVSSNYLEVGPSVTSLGNDTLSITTLGTPGRLAATSQSLAAMTRGVNLLLAPGSFIDGTDGLVPTINNLGNNADLVLALHPAAPLTLTIGDGTPWGGIAGSIKGSFIGTITPTSNFTLGGGTLGTSATPASFNILSPTPVVVTAVASPRFSDAALASSLSDYSGVSVFNVTGTLRLAAANALGGAEGTTPVPVSVLAGGTLSISNADAINAPVTLHSGGGLTISVAGLSGAGAIFRDPGPITVTIGNASALTGSQFTPGFIAPGDMVFLNVSNIVNFTSITPGATFLLDSTHNQSAGFTLNGGGLRFPMFSSDLTPARTGNHPIQVGLLGATLQNYG